MNRSSATPAQDGVVEMKANVDAKQEGTSNPVLQHLHGRMGRGIQQPFTVHTHTHTHTHTHVKVAELMTSFDTSLTH